METQAANAVELGKGARFINFGRVITGASNGFKESYNAITLDGAGGTVINRGTITAGSNGIKVADQGTLLNYGALTGNKGAGLKSKGDAIVVNRGTITGADTWRPRQNDGDGDGLDIDRIAHVYNYGTIEGTGANGKDKGGTPNSSEGIAMGGGEIYNDQNGRIRGAHHGILVDNGDLGPAHGQTRLMNDGIISGHDGYGVKLIGNFNDHITNNGLISGANGIALDMGEGNDHLVVKNASRFLGHVDGGGGLNEVSLDDPKGGIFDGSRNTQRLAVQTGVWTLRGAIDDNRDGRVHTGATLINRSHVGGSLNIEKGATYSGGSVNALNVEGTLQLDLASGAPTHVRDTLRLADGASLVQRFNATGDRETLKVGGTATLGDATLTLNVANENALLENYPYPILNAGAVHGRFGKITDNLKNLTPTLSYTPTAVYVTFSRKP
ncbi:hypothetical protein OOJ96_16005 [Pseudomonas sp. 15FMM2]|uniref:Uncharacterized protein n=1 Tax=Pseudomonas imrae TaxID=2992837 RepID=A0ACC7PJA7_9PSED